MNSTGEIVSTIEEIRAICQKYEERGLSNFPSGMPFVFWEIYVHLLHYLVFAVFGAVIFMWVIISIILSNVPTASILALIQLLIVAKLYGLMGLLDISLSPAPAVILIVSVGLHMNILLPFTMVSLRETFFQLSPSLEPFC